MLYMNIIDNIVGRYFNATHNVKLLEIIKHVFNKLFDIIIYCIILLLAQTRVHAIKS